MNRYRRNRIGQVFFFTVVTVLPTNSQAEMAEKMQLDFDQGSQEVWLCSEAGGMEFHTPTGQISFQFD